MGVRRFLDRHWKFLTLTGLVLGLVSWILWIWIAYDAYSNPAFGEWVVQLDFNAYGEGPFELFFFMPAGLVVIGAAIYTFWHKIWAD